MVRLIILLILSSCLNLNGQILPFRGGLDDADHDLYNQLEKDLLVDSRKAVHTAKQLVFSSQSKSQDQAVWSVLNYASLLAENDSVSKARMLVLDSAELELSSVEPWIQSFQTIIYASILSLDGDYPRSEQLLRAVTTELSPSRLYLLALVQLAENLRFQGKLDLSRINWYESLKLSQQFKDSAYIADCHRGRGIVFFLSNRLENAESDFTVYKKHAVSVGNKKEQANAISLLGLLDYKRGNYQESINKSLESFEIRKDISDQKGQGESLNNLALGYMGLQNWNQALRYLQEAVQMKTLSSDLSQMTVILNNIGHCCQRLENYSEAERYFGLALSKGWNNGQMGDVVNAYNNLIDLSVDLKDFEKAVEYQSRLITIKDSLALIERTKAIDQLEVQFETDKKEQEILMLQQQQTIITNRWLTLALGLFMTIIIGVLIFDNQRRKHKQETELLTAEDELQKAELKIMSDLLEHNQQKLSLYTENLLRKNELVGQLESKLKSAVESSGEIVSEQSELLTNFTGVRILTDKDWEEFKELFDGVHHGMLARLLKEYENLTLAEQRLFLLMKLEMSTKEIANILGVSPDSVKKGRYRLKRKINLSEDISLQDFVSRF